MVTVNNSNATVVHDLGARPLPIPARYIVNSLFESMPNLQQRVMGPSSPEEATEIVDFAMKNIGQNMTILRQSLPEWTQENCHLFAVALKKHRYYSHNNIYGNTLRSLANTVVILENRLAARS
ncbi:MAG: hypothetical protein ACO242_04500 [Candidatus Fonsibacter ubiquis]